MPKGHGNPASQMRTQLSDNSRTLRASPARRTSQHNSSPTDRECTVGHWGNYGVPGHDCRDSPRFPRPTPMIMDELMS